VPRIFPAVNRISTVAGFLEVTEQGIGRIYRRRGQFFQMRRQQGKNLIVAAFGQQCFSQSTANCVSPLMARKKSPLLGYFRLVLTVRAIPPLARACRIRNDSPSVATTTE
jgi:hypothetical protein